MEIIQLVLAFFSSDLFSTVVQAVTAIVTGAAALAALTPTPKDDTILAYIRKVVDWLALNVANAKNAK